MACWWKHLVGPLRRVWLSLSSRLHIKRHRTVAYDYVVGTLTPTILNHMLLNLDLQITPNQLIGGDGLLKLHDDVQTCEYQDVQVMWEMLRRTELELATDHLKHKRHPSWRILIRSKWKRSRSAASYSAKMTRKELHNSI